ncbi:MAG: exosortase/archaeosortase family protein [Planctomycetia bacterium]|nr:exosortase/archaeosortase family protein [Planctomycetia bacterium]MCC7314350.1 exosortase/archaeosortase family protein [Planctomycetota bacterium]
MHRTSLDSPQTESRAPGRASVAGRRRGQPQRVDPGWFQILGTSGLVVIVVICALMGWLYKPQWQRLFRMWQNPDWSHGYLIPIFCLYMIHVRKAAILAAPKKGSLAGLGVILLGIATYAYFIYVKIGYPQDLSMLLVAMGLVLLMCGWRILKLTLFPICFFALAIPPPDRIYKGFTQPLQQGAAWLATKMLNLFPGAEVEQAGINIAYYIRGGNQGMFTVAGACSGMRSLLAFVALGLVMAYFTPRPTWHRVAMAVCVVPVALACNVLRVIITGAFQMYGYGNLAAGTPHTVLGLVMFAVGFAIYGAILWTLDHLMVEDPDAEDASGVPA